MEEDKVLLKKETDNKDEDITENALRSQLERCETLMLREIEGMYDCLKGISEPPYTGDEHIAWTLGHKRQTKELEILTQLIELRQVVKQQAIHTENIFDVSEIKEQFGDKWWVHILSEDAKESMSATSSNSKLYENVIKCAIELSESDAFLFDREGLKVDNDKGKYFEELKYAVDKLLETIRRNG